VAYRRLVRRQSEAIDLMPRPIAAIFGFALMSAYWPGITGAATTPRWDVAALLGIALFFAPRVVMTRTHWLGLALLAWLTLSLTWSEGQLDGIDAAFKLCLGAIAFAIGSTMPDLRSLMIGSAIGIAINSGFAIAQAFGWHGIETYDNGLAGLFHNRDRLAAAAAIVAIWLCSQPGRLWLLLPLVVPAMVLAPSRSAWAAVFVGVVLIFPQEARAYRLIYPILVLALIGCVATIAHGSTIGIDQRITLYRDTIAALTPFGHGLGSFWESFPTHAHYFSLATERPEHPHNEWLWLAYEGGFPALALGGAFAISTWIAAADRAVLGGLFVLSGVAMPFHDPATLILGALCAGHLVGRRAADGVAAIDRGIPVCQGVAAGSGQRRSF
jgi:hypothetical protein